MTMVAPYIRYRYLVHMRILTGLYAANVGTDGRIYPRGIPPYDSLGFFGDMFIENAPSYRFDYSLYEKVMMPQ